MGSCDFGDLLSGKRKKTEFIILLYNKAKKTKPLLGSTKCGQLSKTRRILCKKTLYETIKTK
jgi:hypothetical protein